MSNVDEIIEMYTAKPPMTVAQICAELEIYPPQVYAVLAKNGISLRGRVVNSQASTPQSSLLESQLLALRSGYKEGKTVISIARELKISYARALRAAANLKLELLPGVRPKKFQGSQEKEVVADYKETKLRIDEICSKHGISAGTLYKILRKNGVMKITSSKIGKLRGERASARIESIIDETVRRVTDAIKQDVPVEQLLLFDFDENGNMVNKE